MRPRLIVLFSTLVVAAILAVGFLDHRHKAQSMQRASVAHWLCVHRGRLCGRQNPHAIERRWNERELAYAGAIGFIVLANLGLAFGARIRQKPTL